MPGKPNDRATTQQGVGDLSGHIKTTLIQHALSSNAAPGETIGTVAELADKLGVSATTAGRALRGLVRRGLVRVVRNRGIVLTANSEDLKRVIERPACSRTFHTFLSAPFLPWANSEMGRTLAGVEERIARDHARLAVLRLPDSLELQAEFVLDQLSKGSDGGFLFPLGSHQGTQRILDECERIRLPVVLLSPHPQASVYRLGASAAAVNKSYERRVPAIAGKLADLGHRRVALIASPGGLGRFISPFLDEAAEYGFELSNDLVVMCGEFEPGAAPIYAEYAAEKLLALSDPPTAIVVAEDRLGVLARALIEALCSRGVEVGSQMSVVTTALDAQATLEKGICLAGVRPPSFAVGITAADAMMALADGTFSGPRSMDLGGEWVDGDSLGPAPTGGVASIEHPVGAIGR